MDAPSTECRKCKSPMPQMHNQPISTGPFANIPITVTGYRCECGHWNNLKRRKASVVTPTGGGSRG